VHDSLAQSGSGYSDIGDCVVQLTSGSLGGVYEVNANTGGQANAQMGWHYTQWQQQDCCWDFEPETATIPMYNPEFGVYDTVDVIIPFPSYSCSSPSYQTYVAGNVVSY
jgi:hypothetical protein